MTMSFAMRAKRESDTVDQWRGASTCAEIVSVGPVLRARVRGACAWVVVRKRHDFGTKAGQDYWCKRL